jgi:hypothetical protein
MLYVKPLKESLYPEPDFIRHSLTELRVGLRSSRTRQLLGLIPIL